MKNSVKKMEDADYVLNDNQYVNDSVRGIVARILTELNKDPNNKLLASLAKELTYQRIRLAMQNREVAKILQSTNKDANVDKAERAVSVVIQDFKEIDEVVSRMRNQSLDFQETLLEEPLDSDSLPKSI